MLSKPQRAADYLAQRLYRAGCRRAYGMPGGEVLTLIDAITTAGIEFVLVKHENAGVFMAEGDYHRTGAPGILIATLGPGAMNGVNAIANGFQDRVPLIVLTGCVDADEAQTYTHQIIDHSAVFTPITKASFRLTPKSADIIADKAVNIACEPRFGPVHIDVPIDVADTLILLPKLRSRAKPTPVRPTGPDLEIARNWLSTAKCPVIIAGLDAMNENAGAELLSLCETFHVPLITTYKAKGLIPESHPLSLGGAGLSPLADSHLLPFIESADLIILAGYDPIEMRTGWREIWNPTLQNVIEIAPVPNTHYMHQSTLNFTANTCETLRALRKNLTPCSTWTNGEIPSLKNALANSFSTSEPWGPAAVVDTCQSVLAEDTLATADSGAHRILLSQIWACSEPRGLMQSSAFCTMGCAIPLALGAKIASPDRTVISFCGDAGFLMAAGELATIVELGLNPILVVFVDASLALIELKQRQRQMKNQAVEFGHHDFAAVATAFGGAGYTVRTREELVSALDAAKKADTFTLIAAEIEKGAYDGRI